MTVRRVVKDESGMTLSLALMMILLLSVMGAGLLTFVSKDLNTVVETNRAQRAFEVADAGIGAAGRQLAANVVREDYDGDGAGNCGADDIQWSALRCDDPDGLTLHDLDGDGDPKDSVNVTIEYKAEDPGIFPEHFLVISEGTYGVAKRKIETIFKGVEVDAGGGESIGHPLYYTPSDIRIEAKVTLNGISIFSERDILIQGLTTNPLTPNPQRSFVLDYEDSNLASTDSIKVDAVDDELCDWNSATPTVNGCYEDATGNWNTVGRTWVKNKTATTKEYYDKPGFAAEGKICGYDPASGPAGTCATSPSVADGVYGYDSTTGAKTMSRPDYQLLWGNNLTFVDKGNLEPNEEDTITYPFPRPTPIPEGFKEQACRPLTLAACTPAVNNDYFAGSPVGAQWDTLLDKNNPNRIAFVDAQNLPVDFNPPGSDQYKGILVVWCGDLQQNQSFKGIILNLRGDGTAFGSTNCADDPTKGVYTNNGQTCQCWMYAEGGTETRAGLTLKNGSKIFFLPSGDWSFLNGLFANPPPTTFEPQGWRELYE